MTVSLNHTIVMCRDKSVSAPYLSKVMGLDQPRAWGPFLVVEAANGVSLDFHDQPDLLEIITRPYGG